MKHIKPINIESFEEISLDEFRSFHVLSSEDAHIISQLINPVYNVVKNIVSKLPGSFEISEGSYSISISLQGQIKNKTFISPIPDEWFIIQNSRRIKDGDVRYFKCDQLEGLIDCLKQIYI